MDLLECARTQEFCDLWKRAFSKAEEMLGDSRRNDAEGRAYGKPRALWGEIREPIDGIRLITLELPTDTSPARAYLRVWTYHPQSELLYCTLRSHRFVWQGTPLPCYENDQPQSSWRTQLSKTGVAIKGIRYYQDLSNLAEKSPESFLQTLHDILSEFCLHIQSITCGVSHKGELPAHPREISPEPPAAPLDFVHPSAVPQTSIVLDVESFTPMVQDILGIEEDPRFLLVPPSMKISLVNARIGQGTYRQRMLEIWGRRCALTGCSVPEVLIASHARPWSLCETAQQCLDGYNGLLLEANLDRLFDQGLIAFADDGSVITRGESAIDAMVTAKRLRFVDPRHVDYLAWHRNHFGFD